MVGVEEPDFLSSPFSVTPRKNKKNGKRGGNTGTISSAEGGPSPMQELGTIKFVETQAVDPKQSAQIFYKANIPGDGCLFDRINEVTEAWRCKQALWCRKHDRLCRPCATAADCFVAGFPCSPFSGQRPKRHSERCAVGVSCQNPVQGRVGCRGLSSPFSDLALR